MSILRRYDSVTQAQKIVVRWQDNGEADDRKGVKSFLLLRDLLHFHDEILHLRTAVKDDR